MGVSVLLTSVGRAYSYTVPGAFFSYTAGDSSGIGLFSVIPRSSLDRLFSLLSHFSSSFLFFFFSSHHHSVVHEMI